MTSSELVPGQFTLVLHTHLPWLAHHGRWPVGEEWLYQSWAAAYIPLMRVLRRLAAEDRRHLVTLGMTPVVTAQLDDPYCLTGMNHWLANWGLRALEATTLGDPLRQFGVRERAEAERALDDFSTLWAHGGSPLLRELIDCEAIELLGGPLSHPFQPLLNPRLREFALREGPPTPSSGSPIRPTGFGAGMRLRARDGNRLRRSRYRPFHGRRAVAARGHRVGPAGRLVECGGVRP